MSEGVTQLFPGLSLRLPPQNVQAEQALLGALLSNNKALDRCGELRPHHFADEELGRVYSRIAERTEAGLTTSGVSLRGEFGDATIAQLLGSMIAIVSVPEYAAVIRRCARQRALAEIGEGLVTQAYSDADPVELALGAASRIDALATDSDAGTGIGMDDALADAMAAIEEARHRKGPAGLSTGFAAIDNRIGGLEPATLTVLAGRPGMGKSALGLSWAVRAAQSGAGVLMISLEMSSRELARRVLATASGVPVTAMKYGRVDTDQASRIILARKTLAGLPLTIDDGAGLTATQIAGRARAAKRKGLGLVVVDHLHIVRPDDADAKQGATWAVGRISGAMKRLAKDCGVPVLLLAQLNRGVEGRDDKRPGLGDLRQAGDIEQDADAVGFVYRPEYYIGGKPDKKPSEATASHEARVAAWESDRASVAGDAELIWAKVRDGEPGTDKMRFHGPTTTFSEADP